MAKVKAAKEGATGLLDYLIRAWHGSAADFDRFDSQYIGTGEGPRAYGHGHYAADQQDVGEYYRDAVSRLHANRAGLDDAPKGKLYEVGIKAPPESFLDWDKPISQQTDFIKERLGVIGSKDEVASLMAQKAKLTDEYERLYGSPKPKDDFDSLFDGDAREGALLWDIHLIDERINDLTNPKDIRIGNSVIPVRDQDAFLGGRIIEEGGKTEQLSDELSGLGIRGVKYLDAASRNTGEGSNNYVVFNDDDIDIINKYLRPETAAIGLTQALTNQDITDLNQQVAIDSGMAQLGYDKNRPEAAMYNYSGLLPIKRHKDARGLTDGWLYGYEPAMTGILEEIARGLIDVGESRRTGRIQNPASLFDILF